MCVPFFTSLFSKVEAANFRGHISDSQAAPAPLLPVYELDGAPTAAQVLVMGPDDFIVAMVRYASSGLEPATRNHSRHDGSWGWVGVKAPAGLNLTSTRSSLNRPFGSGLLTPSGILLNSQMLDFSWPNRTANHSAPSLVGSRLPLSRGP